jgi:hypothetical protein
MQRYVDMHVRMCTCVYGFGKYMYTDENNIQELYSVHVYI